MSRSYYVRIDFKNINKYEGGFNKSPIDRIWIHLIEFCGYEQILKVDETNIDDDGVEYVAHIIMGCSGGDSCQSKVDDIVQLFKDTVPVEEINAYYAEDKTEGSYYSEEGTKMNCEKCGGVIGGWESLCEECEKTKEKLNNEN